MNQFQPFRHDFYRDRRGAAIRPAALLLAAACAGYVVEANIRASLAARDVLSVSAAPVNAAAVVRIGAQTGPEAFESAWTMDESSWERGGRTQDPRECDVATGIVVACIFMD